MVFAGTVIAPTGDVEPGSKPIDVTFRVEQVYKGTVEHESKVNTTSDSGSCGLGTPMAGRYLMFANEDARGLVNAGLCGGTRSLSGDAPKELGPETVLSSGSSTPADTDRDTLRPITRLDRRRAFRPRRGQRADRDAATSSSDRRSFLVKLVPECGPRASQTCPDQDHQPNPTGGRVPGALPLIVYNHMWSTAWAGQLKAGCSVSA